MFEVNVKNVTEERRRGGEGRRRGPARVWGSDWTDLWVYIRDSGRGKALSRRQTF